jgi:hypothetical protein
METIIYCNNPACRQKLAVDESYWGRSFHCPACGAILQMPFPSQPAIPNKTTVRVSPQMETPPLLRVRIFRLLTGWSVSAVLSVLLLWSPYAYRVVSQPYLPVHLDEIVREVSSPGGLLDIAPVSNNKETLLLYARGIDKETGLYLANMTTLERKQIELGPSAKLPPLFIGWSPDDRYLAVAITDKKKQTNRHILICDGASGAAKNSIDLPDTPEQGVWLSTNSLIFSTSHKLYLYNFDLDRENLGQYGKQGLVQLRFDSPVAPSSLVPIGGRAVAYDDGTNIWHLILSTCRLAQLTHLTNAAIGRLDYNPENRSFLFSFAIPGEETDSSLYRFDPRTNSATSGLAQFTDRYNFEHIYYGNWIAEGAGLAYAGQNFIGVAIDNENGAFHTNLFSGGSYRNFSVSPRGDKIFALASVANEPLGIWEYDINYSDLDNVVPPKERLSFSRWADPSAVEIARPRGKQLTFSILTPPDLAAGKKCPAVLNLLGNNPYEAWPQFLANAGVISISIRRQSPDDIKVIVDLLLKQTNVDSRRLYIVGQKTDAAMIKNLLNSSPGLWRGVILIRPSEFPELPDLPPPMPPVLVFGGSNRDLVYALKAERFLQRACQKLIPARLLFDEDIMRVSPKSDLSQERYKTMAGFILTGNLQQVAPK